MKAQFASGRNQICPITLSVISGSVTSDKAGTYYFWLQARNCIGYTIPSTMTSATITAGQGIRLTFPSDCRRNGENWERYAVTFSTTADASTGTLLLEVDAIDDLQQPINLPLSIDLTTDAHLTFQTSTSTLPTLVPNGFIIEYTVKGKLYRYKANSNAIADGDFILDASIGKWHSFSETNTFDIYINDTTSPVLGCDVAIEDLNTGYLISQYYSGDGSDSLFRRIWLYNETSIEVEQGERIGMTIDLQGVDVSPNFTDLFTLVFEGYVSKDTGEIDIYEEDTVTLLPYVNITQSYAATKQSSLTIPKPLPSNTAYQLKVYANFTNSDLARNGLIPAYNSEISIIPFIYSNKGISVGVGAFTGDVILGGDDPNLRRVYPGIGVEVFVDSGSGIVKQFLFENVSPTIVSGLEPGYDGQIIAIDGNGSVFSTLNLTANLAQRALISTDSGESAYSELSNIRPGDANSELAITVVFPTQIRPDYEDVIAGSTKCKFYAEEIKFYVKRTNLSNNSVDYRYFTRPITPELLSDTYLFTYNSGTVDTGFPDSYPNGFYTPTPPTLDSVTNINPAENYTYQVTYNFVYTGTSVTYISHSVEDGCIPEISLTLTEVIEQSTRNKGNWVATTTYTKGDLIYDSSSKCWWIANTTSTNIVPSPSAFQWQLLADLSYRVKTSVTDTVPDYLEDKLVAGTGIALTKVNTAGNETLRIDNNESLTIQKDNLSLPKRGLLNFVGDSVLATDTGTKTQIKIVNYQTFTGLPNNYTPSTANLFYVRTDNTPNLLYRSTGTTLGALTEIGGAGGGGPVGQNYILKYTAALGVTEATIGHLGANGTINGGTIDPITELYFSEYDLSINFSDSGMPAHIVLASLGQNSIVKIYGESSNRSAWYRLDVPGYFSLDYYAVTYLGGDGDFIDGEVLQVSFLSSSIPFAVYYSNDFNINRFRSQRIFVDCTNNNVTGYLPIAAFSPGIVHTFKRIDNSSNTLSLVRGSTNDTIEGNTSLVLSGRQSATLHCNGSSAWYRT